jgi:hypothetical protein
MSSEMEKKFMEELTKLHEQNKSYGIIPRTNYNGLLHDVKSAAANKKKKRERAEEEEERERTMMFYLGHLSCQNN